MATESTAGSDLSVTVPPPLAEWLDERAASLDVDREELLVRLAGAYRAATDLGDPIGEPTDDTDTEGIESRLANERALAESGDRVDDVESDLEDGVEDLRSRVLRLRDAVTERAEADHAHEEFGEFDARLDGVSEELAGVEADAGALADRIETIESRLADLDGKLLRVARAVVALRAEVRGPVEEDRRLEDILKAANRNGITEADCAACQTSTAVALLTEPACPHCGTDFRGIEPAGPGLGRRLGFRTPKLTVASPPAGEADDG